MEELMCVEELYGVTSSAIEQAHQNAHEDLRRWAQFLFHGDEAGVLEVLNYKGVVVYSNLRVAHDLMALVRARLISARTGWRLVQQPRAMQEGKEVAVMDIWTPQIIEKMWDLIAGKANKLPRIRKWGELLREINRAHFLMDTSSEPLPKSRRAELNGVSCIRREWHLAIPTTTRQLRLWGYVLHNCIGSYAEQALRDPDLVMVGVYVKGRIAYCVQLQGGEVVQFLGDWNCYPPRYLEEDVKAALQTHGESLYLHANHPEMQAFRELLGWE